MNFGRNCSHSPAADGRMGWQSIALSTIERTEALSSGSASEDSAEIVVVEEAGRQDWADKEKVSSSGNSRGCEGLALRSTETLMQYCVARLESATVDKSRLVDFTLSMIYHPSSVFQRCALHAAMLTSANEVAQKKLYTLQENPAS